MIQINLNQLVNSLVPPLFRKPKFLTFIYSITNVINLTNNRFRAYYEDVKYDLSFTGQVIYLEHLLNNKYDEDQRRIYIEDKVQNPEVFIYKKSEQNESPHLYRKQEAQTSIFYRSEETALNSEFVINIPTAVNFNETELKVLVNKYKLASKTFSIQIIP